MASKSHQDILLMRWALFSVTGIILIVALYSLGVTPAWSTALRASMAQPPFLISPESPALSPGAGFLLCILMTLAVACDLLLISGKLRKTAILAVFLILLACFTPVLGLWGIFFNPVPCLLSSATTGLLAIFCPQRPAHSQTSESPLTHE